MMPRIPGILNTIGTQRTQI